VADQKGVIWFTEAKAGKIGRIDPTNWSISEFAPVNSTLLGPTGVAIGPDGEVWITEHSGNRITSFDPANQTFGGLVVPNNQAFPFGLAFHGKERVWFVEHIANSIATFDLNTGRYDSFPIPTPSSGAQLLAIDSGGNVWFTLPATNSFGVLTSTTSALQLETTSAPDQLVQLVLPAVVTIAVVTCIVLVAGQRSMKKKEESYQSCQGNQSC
jgi:streptogramin lyase